jgi:hypothetical protein
MFIDWVGILLLWRLATWFLKRNRSATAAASASPRPSTAA